MQTPIFDFVQQYQQGGTARFHMPGHKGKAFLGCESLDITEIAGADNLQHPELGGIIAQSEAGATALFGAAQTHYSAGGSSAAISAMLYLAKCAAPEQAKGRILAGRNAHKVFLQACALLDIQPSWLYPAPQDAQGLCSCIITPVALGAALAAQQAQNELPMAVYLTSPDYLGNLADVAQLAAVCAQYGLPLLVDNAHGAYLKFLQPSQHPMDLGAAMCADSAHKTLPVLTGGAYLHIGKAAQNACPDAKAALSLFSSTSPSYLILQSLDLCNAYLSGEFPAALADCVTAVDALKEALCAVGYRICEGEPLKLTIDCRAGVGVVAEDQNSAQLPVTGGSPTQNGEALAEYLRRQGIEVEFADPDFLVCMITPQNTAGELERLRQALLCLAPVMSPSACAVRKEIASPTVGAGVPCPQGGAQVAAASPSKPAAPTPQMAQIRPHATTHTLRDALFSTGEEILVENAAGRTCRLPSVSCPPAIPIVVSGEVITAGDIALFQYYGIETVNVIDFY